MLVKQAKVQLVALLLARFVCVLFRVLTDVVCVRLFSQAEVRELAAVMPVEEGPQAPFYWCNADFIRDWADNAEAPSSIDNRPIMCVHEKADPTKTHMMKRISPKAWEGLQKYRETPVLGAALTEQDCCEECLRKQAIEARETDKQVRQTAVKS